MKQIYSVHLNQRTSGPVAHLTLGPGIYFTAFIHVYSPRAGADLPPPGLMFSPNAIYPSQKVTEIFGSGQRFLKGIISYMGVAATLFM